MLNRMGKSFFGFSGDRQVWSSGIAYGPEKISSRSANMKSIFSLRNDRFEFYDLDADPDEFSPIDDDSLIMAFDTFTVEEEFAAIAAEFRPAEPQMKLEVLATEAPSEAWDDDTARTVLTLVSGLPHGALSMSYDIPGLVETSTNLATVKRQDGSLEITLSSRSSVASALVALRQRIRATASLAGASVEEGNGYPGWKPDLESLALAVVKKIHQRELGTEPEVGAIHAGLECGLIGEMIPGMDMISFGPQIEFPHSPDERVHIDSVGRFYRLLTATLEELAS